ncbi:MAG: hypothetical protein ACJZ59_04090 [Candidatus Thalassarchaeaceae archaeon]
MNCPICKESKFLKGNIFGAPESDREYQHDGKIEFRTAHRNECSRVFGHDEKHILKSVNLDDFSLDARMCAGCGYVHLTGPNFSELLPSEEEWRTIYHNEEIEAIEEKLFDIISIIVNSVEYRPGIPKKKQRKDIDQMIVGLIEGDEEEIKRVIKRHRASPGWSGWDAIKDFPKLDVSTTIKKFHSEIWPDR